MAEPITLKGIQRNASKLAVEDGRAEDLINLRFKDGSWRTAGDGKQVFAMTNETTGVVYEQLYIHTMADYLHILGVNPQDSKLYWFANIANDGETFTALEEPKEICKVANGDLYITQSGHLITVIDSSDDFEYAIFVTGGNEYRVLDVDSNGDKDSRELYPLGMCHINFSCPNDDEHKFEKITKEITRASDIDDVTLLIAHSDMLEMFAKATENNKFTGLFLVLVAFKLYDGSDAFASMPILVNPLERCTYPIDYFKDTYKFINDEGTLKFVEDVDHPRHVENIEDDITYIPSGLGLKYMDGVQLLNTFRGNEIWSLISQFAKDNKSQIIIHKKISSSHITSDTFAIPLPEQSTPVMSSGCSALIYGQDGEFTDYITQVNGSDLVLSIGNIENMRDIITGMSIYITKPISLYDLSAEGYKKSPAYINDGTNVYNSMAHSSYEIHASDAIFNLTLDGFTYSPYKREMSNIIYELTNSPFYLLREYSIAELNTLQDNPIVDLSAPKYKGLLENITQQKQLDYESQSRTTYIPKVAYQYNGKLHIANYKTIPFHGYPLDCFHLHNHSLEYAPGETFEGVLPNLRSNNDEYLQFPKFKYQLDQQAAEDIAAVVRVTIDTQQGEQVVCRYISSYDYLSPTSFIESLNPIITYPDSRAKKMDILFAPFDDQGGYFECEYGLSVELKPHPYLNIAYAITNDLKPFEFEEHFRFGDVTDIEDFIKEINNVEAFPNGLKASKTNNPFFFPVDQAYQVGNGEIVALCSNAIAVGTGQTGAAPLYVFCTDGIYALYVDASGEMAYTNARIIARDVCNNAKSVTPIDTGVVFTTDRGLMEIAGDVVNEIGQPAEGDVVEYTEPNWAKPQNVGKNMLTKVANLPLTLVDGVDFLAYLKGAIVNYNHNERELMVSNPDYPYSYVLDRYSNWSRRDYSADEYVNNYPTSYRVKDGVFYKVDAEQDGLEGKSEAPNDFLYLSNVIKLGSVDFKKAYRFVVRGKFDTNNGTENKTLGVYIFGSYDGRQFAMLGANEKRGTFTDIGCKIERTDVKYFRVGLAGYLSGDSRIDFMEVEGEQSNLTTKLR